MSTLKHTSLRHRLLAEVAAGRRHIYQGLQWTLINSNGSWCKPGEMQAMEHLRALVDPGRRFGGNESLAVLNEAGRAILADWDSKHGVVVL